MTGSCQCRKHSVPVGGIAFWFDSPGLGTRPSTVTAASLRRCRSKRRIQCRLSDLRSSREAHMEPIKLDERHVRLRQLGAEDMPVPEGMGAGKVLPASPKQHGGPPHEQSSGKAEAVE